MIDERDIAERFHSAFDVQPSPGAALRLRARLVEHREKRQEPARAWAAIVAILLTTALIAGLIGVRYLSHPQSVRPGPHAVTPVLPYPYLYGGLNLVRMTSASTGWAAGGLRTTDGGLHWRNVSPPAQPGNLYDQFHPEFYLDANHAWLGQRLVDRVLMFRTTDGGSSWDQISPLPASARSPYFVDPEHGWLVTESWPDGAAQPDAAASGLYETADGGLRWKLQPQPVAGCYAESVVFVTPAVGWVGIYCPRPTGGGITRLLSTRDGGETWQPDGQEGGGLCPPCTSNGPAVGIPTFIDQSHWMVVDGRTLYLTADAGRTWDARPIPGNDLLPPAGQLGGPMASVSFGNANAGWAFVWLDTKNATVRSSRLYRTLDGGRTWTLMRSNLPSMVPDRADIMFVDARTGFLTHLRPQGKVDLLKTQDGGQTWAVIDYRVQGLY